MLVSFWEEGRFDCLRVVYGEKVQLDIGWDQEVHNKSWGGVLILGYLVTVKKLDLN